jgi:hypothetical protein
MENKLEIEIITAAMLWIMVFVAWLPFLRAFYAQ